MKLIYKSLLLLLTCGLVSSAWAATIQKNGVTITYTGGTGTTESNGDVLLRFTTGTDTAGTQTGSFSFEGTATASILVVGGGGSGGKSNDTNSYWGSGNGGTVNENLGVALGGGAYTVSVGNGGASVTSNGTRGNAGVKSSISGSFPERTSSSIEADGGARGGNSAADGTGASGSGRTGVTSQITGGTYGTGGVKATGSVNRGIPGGANTGDGGTGNRSGSDRPSGAGGSGIVVVRITAIEPPHVEFQGQTIYYTGGTYAWDGNELVFTFTEDGTLNLPLGAMVDYVVVGGGGSGATGRNATSGTGNNYYGSGGNGGSAVADTDFLMPANTYEITVGDGGDSVSPGSSSARTAGENGGNSTIVANGFEAITGLGGSGGGTGTPEAGSAGTKVMSDIVRRGTNVTYGGNGGAVGAARTKGADGTGVGDAGAGGGRSATYSSGAGGDGIVIVRVKSMLPQVSRTAVVYTGRSITLSDLDGTVASVATGNSSVASVTRDGNTVTVTGAAVGSTTVTVTTSTTIYTYNVTVKDREQLAKTLLLAVGADSATTAVEEFDSITSVTGPTTAGVVEMSRSGNVLSFTAQAAGETTVTVVGVLDGVPTEMTYTLKVSEFASSVAPFEDSYIVYDGASTNWINGDLVLIYTNVQQSGTFQIPAPYTASVDILAVGGGGGGGSTESFGQGGGGGGAGGYSSVTNKKLVAGSFIVEVGIGGHAGTAVGTASRGSNGGDSLVTNVFGYAFANAKGGGGGGAPADVGASCGLNGGSGGGATWYGSTLGYAGTGIAGQGASGGVPSVKKTGGGGGGAGGAGGADRTGGAGKTSSITGESVLYSQGGRGGRNDSSAVVADATEPGFGGPGGNGGPGGAGADGVVVVRITDMVRNIKVPVPTTNDLVKALFVWKEGETYTAFDYEGKSFISSTDAQSHAWADAIKSVTGVTSTNCTLSATEMDPEDPTQSLRLGAGYHSFTITLKDGYSWEDNGGAETAGDTGSRSYRWVVLKDKDMIAASIDVHKAVSWTSTSNATVTVTTFSSPEAAGKSEINVLFLGTRCQAHELTPTVIKDSINACLESANVDWYIYDKGNSTPVYQGQNKKGDVINPGIAIKGSVHSTLNEFYNHLYNVIHSADSNKYDYVVFEFDGSRIACSYAVSGNWTLAKEKEVAQWLKPFYDNESVVWIVDNCYCGSSASSKGNEPFGGDGVYWTPNSAEFGNSGHVYPAVLSNVAYRGLVGMFDPALYLEKNPTASTTPANLSVASVDWNDRYYASENAGSTSNGPYTFYAANRYDTQVYYDNASACAELLRATIKPKPYNLALRDKIVDPSKGLTVTNVTIMACTNGVNGVASTDESDWVDLICWDRATGKTTFPMGTGTVVGEGTLGIPGASLSVDIVSNLVQGVISNVDYDVWTRVKINVVDDGKFRTSEDAVYDQATGMWQKNPNEGKAFAEMINSMGIAMKVDGDAETSVPWSFTAYTITANVSGGEVFVNGEDRTSLSIGEGLGCTVYYRGYGGYKLQRLIVDGVEVPYNDANGYECAYTFNNIQADHEVQIIYVPFSGEVVSTPVTNRYDGAVHPYTVTLTDWDETIETEVRFARWEDRDDPTKYYPAEAFCASNLLSVTSAYNASELTDVGDHDDICFRVFALQKGYGKSLTDEGWVWVQSSAWETVGTYGVDHSVILPVPLTVRPADSDKIYFNDPLPAIPYELKGFVNGETEADLGGATAGWTVASSYRKGIDGVGMYPTWVKNANGVEIWNGDPLWVEPNAVDEGQGLYNIGNYYLKVARNFQPVEKIPLSIGDVPQGPGLDPEIPNLDTGVDPSVKMYDGVPTGITVTVTTTELVEGTDYDIFYAVGDLAHPGTAPAGGITGNELEFLHAGTNVVWYLVQPKGEADTQYFAASNYQYVVITPRPLVLESKSQTWEYNGGEHAWDVITLNGGTLVNGDTLTTNTTARIVNVGSLPNEFTYGVVSGDSSFTGDASKDYAVTKILGTLAVTPAHVQIGETTYPDPDDDDYPSWGDNDPETGKSLTGVEDAIKVYDGIGTNIFVDVKLPAEGEYRILYSTNTEDTASWTTDLPIFTNVVDIAVWFAVEPIGPSAGNYYSVTNFARVWIQPREAVVTADDKTTVVGTPPPAYTAQVSGLIADDLDRVDELIAYTLSCPTYEDAVGSYPILAAGEANQGNYHVTYIPGTLTVEAHQRVVSLWIVDHADAGAGRVHLAFKPTLNGGTLSAAFLKELETAGAIKVKCAATEAELVNAELRSIVSLRDGTGTQHLGRGWIWITVDVPDDGTGPERLWKIVVELPAD